MKMFTVILHMNYILQLLYLINYNVCQIIKIISLSGYDTKMVYKKSLSLFIYFNLKRS